MNKSDARKTALFLRNQMTDEQVKELSGIICDKIIKGSPAENLKPLEWYDEILTYVNYGNEVVTRPVIEASWSAGKRVAVPKVISSGQMEFRYIESFDDLEPGAMGIPEPKEYCRKAEITTEQKMTKRLIIMPGVAFDEARNRIGYGGGFYDRWIAENTRKGRDVKAAAAFETQLLDRIDAEEHDIKPDVIITEKRIAIISELVYNDKSARSGWFER